MSREDWNLPDDAALVADVLARVPEADIRFLRKLRPLIRAVATGFFAGQDIDDVEQDVIARIWDRNFRVLRMWRNREGSLKAYLTRVVRNHCIDRVRNRLPAHVLIDDMEAHLPDPDPAANPLVMALARRIRDCIADAKLGLARAQRKLWELRHEQHLSHQEIAEQLNKTPGYVGPTLARAERNLRKTLTKRCPDLLPEAVRPPRPAGGG